MEYNPIFTEKIEVQSTIDEQESPFPERITTDRLVLTPLTKSVDPSDILTVYQQNSGTDDWFTTETGLPQRYDEILEYFELVDTLMEQNTDMFYLIRDKQTDSIIGQATIEDVDFVSGRCGIGIWLRESCWGKSISQERAECVLYAIFEELPISTVEIRVSTENTNSIKAVEKYLSEFGGVFEGCLRNATRTPVDKVTDVLVWSITEEEFVDPTATYNRDGSSVSKFI